jgi:hypothetical protein
MAEMRRPMGDAAHQYARDWLWLSRGLQPVLRSALDPQWFRSWTIASPEVSDHQLARFGAAIPVFSGEVGLMVAQELAPIVAGGDGRVLLAPDPMGTPGDAFLEGVNTPYLIVDDAIYYVAQSSDVEVLASAWRAAASAAGQMAVVTEEGVDMSNAELDLQRAARATVALAISAYDGLGALFFTAL